MAKQGAQEGLVVWADSQNAGKGRRGRSWESPAGTNLYFSILLRPKISPEKAPMLTLVMAYAVAKAVKDLTGLDVRIKWPNDLVLSKKKICGILTEMYLTGTDVDYIVVGTGINVNGTEFSEELREKATSLYLEMSRETEKERIVESKKFIERKKLLEESLRIFGEQYQTFLEVQDLSFLQKEYNQMLINQNREVVVLEPGNEYHGMAIGINSDGELLVETEKGIQTVFAGEVSVRGIYGYV